MCVLIGDNNLGDTNKLAKLESCLSSDAGSRTNDTEVAVSLEIDYVGVGVRGGGLGNIKQTFHSVRGERWR